MHDENTHTLARAGASTLRAGAGILAACSLLLLAALTLGMLDKGLYGVGVVIAGVALARRKPSSTTATTRARRAERPAHTAQIRLSPAADALRQEATNQPDDAREILLNGRAD